MLLGGIATYALNFPGSMEDDSFVQLLEGRSQSYSYWHPPVMSWLMGLSDALPGPAAAWFVALDMLLAFGALTAVLWLTPRVSRRAIAVAAVLLFLPQLFLLQAVVWKDALFADATLAGFAALALAVAHWPRRRTGLLTAAAALLALAVLTRQNGAVVLPCAALGLFFAVRKQEGWRRAASLGAVFLGLAAVMALAGNQALAMRWDGYPAKQEQFKILHLYDVTGMVKRDPALRLDILDKQSPRLAKIIRGEGVARWSPVKNDTLEMSPRIVAALDATPAPVLRRQWQLLVQHNPGRYLALRAILFRWVFEPPDAGLCHPFHVGDQGDPGDLKELGLKPRLDRRDIFLWQAGDVFLAGHVFSHGLFALIAGFGLYATLRRRRPADLVMASLIAAAFVFTATFFVISIACDYRYLLLIDMSALAGMLYLAADWPGFLAVRKNRGI
jgi:4-amino-4-deoxy-L-arabinose transferase-like glycosyltransferase